MQGRLVSDFGWKGLTNCLYVCCYLRLSPFRLYTLLKIMSVRSFICTSFLPLYVRLLFCTSVCSKLCLSICLIRTALFPSVSRLYVRLFFYLSVRLFCLYMSVCSFVCLYAQNYFYPSVYLFNPYCPLSVCKSFICPSVLLSVCPSFLPLYVRLFFCLSVRLFSLYVRLFFCLSLCSKLFLSDFYPSVYLFNPYCHLSVS
jgi:hypothetical protein